MYSRFIPILGSPTSFLLFFVDNEFTDSSISTDGLFSFNVFIISVETEHPVKINKIPNDNAINLFKLIPSFP